MFELSNLANRDPEVAKTDVDTGYTRPRIAILSEVAREVIGICVSTTLVCSGYTLSAAIKGWVLGLEFELVGVLSA